MKRISVLVPCFNEEENVSLFWHEIKDVFTHQVNSRYELELLYIDDGSRDGTLGEIKKLASGGEGGENIFHFPGILERKPLFTPVLNMPPVISLLSWMWIFRIRRRSSRR